MSDKSSKSQAKLRDEFAQADDGAFVNRSIVAAALNRTNGWLHWKEKRGEVPPFIVIARSRLYRKKDVLAYFFQIKTSQEVKQ